MAKPVEALSDADRATIQRALLDTVNPEAYYSAEDAGDWHPAFMRAQAAGRVIDLKPGATYEISRAIDNVSDRLWRLNTGSIINIRTHANTAQQSAFLLGNIHPDMCDYANRGTGNNLACHDIAPLGVGAMSGILSSSGDRLAYSPGQFVLIRHVTDVAGTDGRIPLYAQFNKITSVASDGTLSWEDPLLEAISQACISPLGGTDNIDNFMNAPWRMVKNVTIETGSLGGRSLVSTRTGAWKCRITDIRAAGVPLFLFAVNAFVHCVVDGFLGNSESRLVEVKAFSQDSVFRRMGGAMTGNMSANAVEVSEQANRCTLSGVRAVVPTVWIGLLDHVEAHGETLPSLERIIVGGSPMPAALMERLERGLGVVVQTSWGMTELSPLGTMASSAASRRDAGVSGRPSVGIDLLLTDAAGRPLPEQRGVEGHLRVRGPAVVEHYFGQDEAATDAEGWFATGDLARIDAEGNLTITGRAKDLIKSGGEWINPAHIEEIVGALPEVSMAAVVGRTDPKWGERPILLVEMRKGADIADGDLLGSLRGQVASWWIPETVIRLPEMPKAATGKIDKMRLRTLYSQAAG